MRRRIEDLLLILKALGIRFPPLIYIIYLGVCFFFMMQTETRDIGLGFLIGGTLLMLVWSHFKHKKKE